MSSGTRIKVAAILVDIGKEQVRIVFETVKHAISVMGVDIDVSDSLQSVIFSQILNGDATVVEHTKPGGMFPARVVKSGNGYKCPLCLPLHDSINRCQRGADDVCGNLEHARKCRGITAIKKTSAVLRFLRDKIDVIGRMKKRELVNRRSSGHRVVDRVPKSSQRQLLMKDLVPIRTEWMPIAESIASELLTPEYPDRSLLVIGQHFFAVANFATGAAYLIIPSIMRASFYYLELIGSLEWRNTYTQ